MDKVARPQQLVASRDDMNAAVREYNRGVLNALFKECPHVSRQLFDMEDDLAEGKIPALDRISTSKTGIKYEHCAHSSRVISGAVSHVAHLISRSLRWIIEWCTKSAQGKQALQLFTRHDLEFDDVKPGDIIRSLKFWSKEMKRYTDIDCNARKRAMLLKKISRHEAPYHQFKIMFQSITRVLPEIRGGLFQKIHDTVLPIKNETPKAKTK